MISEDDIEAFQAANGTALETADRIIERAERGTTKCRLFHANEELSIVRALRAQRQIIAWLTDAVDGFQKDQERRFEEAVGIFDRNGNRTG